ncbi:hypothetical protein AMTR_s00032p00124670 [Amborella trichopoda]|uniref:Uncharacterized protein n=1 Tax=Amborella trichopoda TaxID=13333 RepID=U5CXF5_AMBTC|nr:hypothetical protein AMTR_s00032p00124670 [Amborella trichopoda]
MGWFVRLLHGPFRERKGWWPGVNLEGELKVEIVWWLGGGRWRWRRRRFRGSLGIFVIWVADHRCVGFAYLVCFRGKMDTNVCEPENGVSACKVVLTVYLFT